jgi:hypothetical protein
MLKCADRTLASRETKHLANKETEKKQIGSKRFRFFFKNKMLPPKPIQRCITKALIRNCTINSLNSDRKRKIITKAEIRLAIDSSNSHKKS